LQPRIVSLPANLVSSPGACVPKKKCISRHPDWEREGKSHTGRRDFPPMMQVDRDSIQNSPADQLVVDCVCVCGPVGVFHANWLLVFVMPQHWNSRQSLLIPAQDPTTRKYSWPARPAPPSLANNLAGYSVRLRPGCTAPAQRMRIAKNLCCAREERASCCFRWGCLFSFLLL
jgi:hypothetical protein